MYIDHRYEVLEELGHGSWAHVFKVRDIRSDVIYSLKKYENISSEDFYSRFNAELMHKITMIEHPNLSHIVDFGHVSDHVYYISEYFEGLTLDNFRFSPGRIDQVYDLIVQCAYALNALHTQKILHRDLKPQNILYRVKGHALEVKLIDYGFTKVDNNLVKGKERERLRKTVAGSLPYIAPEVYLGKEASPASDYYSLGVLLYRVCTQQYPFSEEQVNDLVNGSGEYFTARQPNLINKDIPEELSGLIINLMDRNPENRIQTAKELISYVNRISRRSYPFSISWTLVNRLRFNSYIIRAEYTRQLLDYLPSIRSGNGKIVSLVGGDGLGKESILSLFRYHLLGGEFFLFDYSCTRREHEAFFALIKEYLRSLPREEIERFESLKKISEKFRSYLFESEASARHIVQSAVELKGDFDRVRDLLSDLLSYKPIIFIIRNFQYVSSHTIDFINYLAKYLINQQILVVLSSNDFNKISMIKNTVLLSVPMLTEDQTRQYVIQLLDAQVPTALIKNIFRRSAGNPYFIREILLDLAKKKQLTYDEGYRYATVLEEYQLPVLVQKSIKSRMNRISSHSTKLLRKLAVVKTPLSREMIVHILSIEDQQLYTLFNEAIYNEVFIKRGKYYSYAFPEARDVYFGQSSEAARTAISRRVLEYYEIRELLDDNTFQKMLRNVTQANKLIKYELIRNTVNEDVFYRLTKDKDLVRELIDFNQSRNEVNEEAYYRLLENTRLASELGKALEMGIKPDEEALLLFLENAIRISELELLYKDYNTMNEDPLWIGNKMTEQAQELKDILQTGDKMDEETFTRWDINEKLTQEAMLSYKSRHEISESPFRSLTQNDELKQKLISLFRTEGAIGEEAFPPLNDNAALARQILESYKTRNVIDEETCLGLIENAHLAEDMVNERKFLLKLYDIYSDDFEHEKACHAILDALRIDFELSSSKAGEQKDYSHQTSRLIKDLRKFHEKVEAIGYSLQAGFMEKNAILIPEVYEKYLVLGTLKMLKEDTHEALELFEKAKKLAFTGKQNIQALLYLARVATYISNEKTKDYLDQIIRADQKYKGIMKLSTSIGYIDRKAVYLDKIGETELAINLMEDFLRETTPDIDYQSMLAMAGIHNKLGVFYSRQKNIPEAAKHLNLALEIWKRQNIKRHLALVYNNIADLYLKQGLTIQGQHYSQLGYTHAEELGLTMNQALSLLNQGEAGIKMGQFHVSELKLNEARQLILSVNGTMFLDSIMRNLALARSKIKGFGYYYSFISENEPELIKGKIKEINPLVKTYFYYLHEVSNQKKLRSLLRQNAHINYREINEEEFYHNILSLIALSEKDYHTALNELRLAKDFAGGINNNYALAVFNVLLVCCHYGLKEYAKAREIAEEALIPISENQYLYWETKLNIMLCKLDLMNPELPLREVLRRVNGTLAICIQNQYYQLEVELRQVKLQILWELEADKMAADEFKIYRELLERITSEIDEEDRANYLQTNHYSLTIPKKLNIIPLASRRRSIRTRWNEVLYNIANEHKIENVKTQISLVMNKIICPARFMLMIYSETIREYYCFLSMGYSGAQTPSPTLWPHISKALEHDTLIGLEQDGNHIQIIPLLSGSLIIGYLIVSDDGELNFTRIELSNMRSLKQHFAALITRVNDYARITMRMKKMDEMLLIMRSLMEHVDMKELEEQTVSMAIDFTNATRGFLIRKDGSGTDIYTVRLDYNKMPLDIVTGVSKTAINLCQTTNKPLISINAKEDKTFEKAVSVEDYSIHSIYCCPVMVGNEPRAWLYLDNMGEESQKMYLNEEILSLFQAQIGIAFKNAGQYDAILKKSKELNELENLKDEFMAIVSHELNTPLAILQGYISRLKRNLFADEDERTELINKMAASVRKLIVSFGDISVMNFYNLASSLPKSFCDVNEILDLVHQEVEILLGSRKMFIKMEVEKHLPPLMANWEAIHRMVYNVVINAIRFTADFGSITISARRVTNENEKIDGRDTLVIAVEDNGIGIAEFQQSKIYRKFYELNEIYAHKTGTVEFLSSGLGLGLATVKRIAELHGGFTRITSTEEKGTKMFMILPFNDTGTKSQANP